MKINCNLILIVFFIILVYPMQAGVFHAIVIPDGLLYSSSQKKVWKPVSTGDSLQSGILKLPSRTYIMFLHSSGNIYSADTSGEIDLQVLEQKVKKQSYQKVSHQIISRSLESWKERRIPIINFTYEISRCRCMSNIFIFGEDNNTVIRSSGANFRWISKIISDKYYFKVSNYFDEELLKKDVKKNEIIPINNSILKYFKSEGPLILEVGTPYDGNGRISIQPMSANDEKAYTTQLLYLQREYKTTDDLQYIICKLLMERQNRLLLECGDSYYELYDRLFFRYGMYNELYFRDLNSERKECDVIFKRTQDKLIVTTPYAYSDLPPLNAKVIIKYKSNKRMPDMKEYIAGVGIVRESSSYRVAVEVTVPYAEMLMQDGKRQLAILEGSDVVLYWQE